MPDDIIQPNAGIASVDLPTPGMLAWSNFFDARRNLLRAWVALLDNGVDAIHLQERDATVSGINQIFDLFDS